VYGDIASGGCTCHDHEHYYRAGDVLGTGVAVGKPSIRQTAREDECDPEGNRGEDIDQIVNGVGQKRRTSPNPHHPNLQGEGRQ
jgi:hypothetical protein